MSSYPAVIKVSGLPFMLQGWNNIYVRLDEKGPSGTPIYELQDYVLYGIIAIAPARIMQRDGHWILIRPDMEFVVGHAFGPLLGKWSDDIVVEELRPSPGINIMACIKYAAYIIGFLTVMATAKRFL